MLVNNAGLSRGLTKVYEDDPENWEEMIDTNIKGLLYVTRAVVPGMVERGRGHVINLGSTAGYMTYANGAVYCATKAAEKAISEGLKIDLMGTPVRVTSVDPGMVETEFSAVRFRGDEERAAKVYQNITPLQPEDVADAIVWAATRPAHVNIHNILMTTIDQANSTVFHRHDGSVGRALEVDGPAQFGQLFFDVGESVGEGGAAVRAGGAFGENPFALKLEGLTLAFAFGVKRVSGCGIGFRGGGLGLLLFHGFALPSS